MPILKWIERRKVIKHFKKHVHFGPNVVDDNWTYGFTKYPKPIYFHTTEEIWNIYADVAVEVRTKMLERRND